MSSLFESLSKGVDKSIEKTSSDFGDFAEKLAVYKDIAVNDFKKFNIDLNQSIAKIAKENNLNDDQIQRIVEEANTQVYLLKYAEMRRFPQREVVFPIAKVASVKDIVVNGVKKNEEVIEKKASWAGEGLEDSLNFLNYTSHETMGMAPDKNRTMKDILAYKLAHEINAAEETLDEKKAAFTSNIHTIADAMVRYDRANVDTQGIFEVICKEASIHKSDQSIIKTAVEQKVGRMKEYRLVPANYELTIELVDIEKQADDFSMGKYSLVKKASATQSNSGMPIVVTDNGTVIRQVSDLISMALNIQRHRDDIKVAEGKKDKLTNISKKE